MPDGWRKPLTDMVYLIASAPIDQKLTEINGLGTRFRTAHDQIAGDNARVALLATEKTTLKATSDALWASRKALMQSGSALKDRLAIAEKYLPLAETNRKSGATNLARESWSLRQGRSPRSRLKSAVGLLGVSGATSSIPPAPKTGRRRQSASRADSDRWLQSAMGRVPEGSATNLHPGHAHPRLH
jgi:hypothetical protein